MLFRSSSGRVIAGYAQFLRSSKYGVRFGVRCGPRDSNLLAAQAVRNGGEGRNRTMSSPTVSLNTLIYKAILTPVLQGFKTFLTLSGLTRHTHGTYPPHTRLLKKSLKISLKLVDWRIQGEQGTIYQSVLPGNAHESSRFTQLSRCKINEILPSFASGGEIQVLQQFEQFLRLGPCGIQVGF